MNILVVGSGGREHTLVWKIAQSRLVKKIYAAPGNAGMAERAECVPINGEDIEGLAALAREKKIDLTVVGPEVPLTLGIADAFRKQGLKVFGPVRAAARLEGDKSFAKEIMRKYGIPTAAYQVFTEAGAAGAYVRKHGAPLVIKASGLAAGKGVLVCKTEAEALQAVTSVMEEKTFGKAGNTVVIEEFMEGEEASILALTDGKTIKTLISSQDHKRAYDGDQGPNTGGMGAYAPAPVVTPALADTIMRQILRPAVDGMAREGTPYTGILYAGLMINAAGPRVVEFNCRFGDPETQAVLPLLKSDLVELMLAVCDGTLDRQEVVNREGAAVCVVQAAGGYPGSYEKGKLINGLEQVKGQAEVMVFHAGTALQGREFVTAGGRVLGITAWGADIKGAIDKAYRACRVVGFEGVHSRKDIGYRALARLQ